MTCCFDRHALADRTVVGFDAVSRNRIGRHRSIIRSQDKMSLGRNHFLRHQYFVAQGTIAALCQTGSGTGRRHSGGNRFLMTGANRFPGNGAAIILSFTGRPGGIRQRILGCCHDAVESVGCNARRASQERNGIQRATAGKRITVDGGHGLSNGGCLQCGIAIEGIAADICDLTAHDCRGNGGLAAVPGISCTAVGRNRAGTQNHQRSRAVQSPPCVCAAGACCSCASPGHAAAIVLARGGTPVPRSGIPGFTGDSGKSFRSKAGIFSRENDCLQVCAANKRIIAYERNRGGDGYYAEGAAAVEGIIADGGHST